MTNATLSVSTMNDNGVPQTKSPEKGKSELINAN